MQDRSRALDGVATLLNYIGGERVPAADGRTLSSVNPATGAPIADVPRSSAADVDAAVAAATAAFPAWSALKHAQRADVLDRVAALIEERLEEFAGAESRDNGKPVSLARAVDVPRAVSNFRFFAGAVRHDETQAVLVEGEAVNYTQRCAVGVAGLISPWNLPLYLLSWKVAPALAMGNCVVAKPSEVTPLTAHLLAEVMHEAGVPPGVFNLVSGLGAEAGQALVEHPGVECVSFTGGTVTGRRVASIAAPMFKKLSLELGGKNSTVVFADCDFERTVAGAVRAAFANQGQVCLAGSRLFVERPVYDRFVEAFCAKARELVPGDPRTANFGALVSAQHLAKVEEYVELARASGAEILLGGRRPAGLPERLAGGAFYEPTVVAGLPADHRCSVEEIFGPVVTVHAFDTEEELLRGVNGTMYGLAGSVWTSNLRRGHQVAHRMRTGMVWVNCWLYRDLRVPFGGVRQSGTGREGGRHSLEFFSESKNVCVYYAIDA